MKRIKNFIPVNVPKLYNHEKKNVLECLKTNWISSEGKFVKDEHVIPFSVGQRYCLGQSLAEKEFFLFFTGLLQKFRFEKCDNEALPSYNIDEVNVKGILRSVPPFKVNIVIRK